MKEGPVVIGGVGGSGTRLFATILKDLGFYLGADLNAAFDNLWFTLLFKRQELWPPETHKKELTELLQIFCAAMIDGFSPNDSDLERIKSLAKNARPQHSEAWLSERVESMLALNKGAKYSIKTRSDVRINKNNLETYLISLINTFPVKENNFIKSRIVVPSLITFKYRLYSLSDITMFGETSDLIKYFNNEEFEEGIKKFNLNKENLLIEQTPVIAEIFLCSRFIYQIEGNISWNLKNWWKCLKDYFCVIDNSSLDLLWYKYDWEYEYRYLRTYSDKFARAIDFQDWLSLYNDHNNNWDLASDEHEKYNNNFQLKNLFKN